MKWTISNNLSNPVYENLAIKFEPYDLIVYAFFIGTNSYYFPSLLYDAVVEKLFSTGMVGVMYHSDLGWYDYTANEIFKEDEVRLTHQDWGESVIEKQLFFEILYDYADKHLNAYRNNMQLQKSYSRWLEDELTSYRGAEYKVLNPNWGIAMQEGLAKLKAKIDNNTGE